MKASSACSTLPDKDVGRWLLLAIAAIAIIYAAIAGLRTVGDYDVGWQIAGGRWIAEHRQIVSTDVFSFTANGRPWIYPVGSGLIFYAAYALGGYALLSWLGALACLGTVAILLRRAGVVTAALAVLAVPIIASRTIPRADMFTVVLFAAFVALLWGYRQCGSAPLWVLPLLMIAWVNLHPGFIFGLALIFAYLITEAIQLDAASRTAAVQRLRRAWPWLAGTIAATVVNPWGPWIYAALVRQQRAMALHQEWITEWAAVPLSWTAVAHQLGARTPESAAWWLLAIAVLAAALAVKRGDPGTTLLLVGAAALGLRYVRFQALFACVAVVVGGSMIARWWETAVGPKTRRAVLVIVVVLCATLAAVRASDLVSNRYYLATMNETSTFGMGPSWWFPEKAAAFIAREHVPGTTYNDYNLGGYLLWRLGPGYQDYIDGRALPFGPQLFLRSGELSELPPDSPEWQKEAERYGIKSIIVSLARYDGLGYFPNLRAFCAGDAWRPVYLDEVSAVFVRRLPETQSLIDRLQVNCNTAPLPAESTPPQSRAMAFNRAANAAAVLHALGRDAEAMAAVDGALALFSGSGDAHHQRGMILASLRRDDEALRELQVAVELDPSQWTWWDLGDAYYRQRQLPEALAAYQHAAQLASHPQELWLRIGYLQLESGRPDEALQAFDRVAEAGPYRALSVDKNRSFHGQLAEGRARAWFQRGDLARAVHFQKEAVGFTPDDPARWVGLAGLYRMQGNAAEAEKAMLRATALRQH